MVSTIVLTLQLHYGGCFVSDSELRYANDVSDLEKINIDVNEMHIMLFHKLELETSVEKLKYLDVESTIKMIITC